MSSSESHYDIDFIVCNPSSEGDPIKTKECTLVRGETKLATFKELKSMDLTKLSYANQTEAKTVFYFSADQTVNCEYYENGSRALHCGY